MTRCSRLAAEQGLRPAEARMLVGMAEALQHFAWLARNVGIHATDMWKTAKPRSQTKKRLVCKRISMV